MITIAQMGIKTKHKITVGPVLLVLITLEASLMGSGRLLEAGPLTVKMWLFLAAASFVCIHLVACDPLKISSTLLMVSLAALLSISSIMGIIHNSTLSSIAEDIKPLLYCFLLPFIDITIETVRYLKIVIRLIKTAAMIMTTGYAVAIALLITGVVSFGNMYLWLSNSSGGDFMFRGDSGMFFYKGSLYIAIGLIFFSFGCRPSAKVATVLAIAGLAATGTRGFFFALMAVVLVHALTGRGGSVRKMRLILIPCAGLAMLLIIFSGKLVGKEDSDALRTETAKQVVDRITPLSFIFGNGFGVGVEDRPVHMENSYLEVFHKQGILGELWWGSLFALVVARYRRARRIDYSHAQPLFLSTVFVAFESLTNPFVNNPIGIFVLLITLVGLDVLSGKSPHSTQVKSPGLAVA